MARISGFRAEITEHTLSSFRRQARARAPPRAPKRGHPVYFYYYYYYFITILLSFKFTALTPEKKYTHRYLHLYYNTTYLPTYITSYLTVSGTTDYRETPSLRANCLDTDTDTAKAVVGCTRYIIILLYIQLCALKSHVLQADNQRRKVYIGIINRRYAAWSSPPFVD